MGIAASWQSTAFNQATESENRIHADEVAKQYGFQGGLVPGVTVHAYLVHPGLSVWGMRWLSGGAAQVTLKKPLYEGRGFRTLVSGASETSYDALVRDDAGVVCAEGRVWLADAPAEMPAMRGDPRVVPRDRRKPATRALMEELSREGMRSLRIEWRGNQELDRYVREMAGMPDTVRPDRDGFANPGFSLGLANWVLARNVRLGPWIHVESTVQNHAPIPLGAATIVEARVLELFERKGHEFVDMDVCVYFEDGRPVLRAQHKAIYVLRKS